MINLKQIPYENHRAIWKSKEFLMEFFRISEHTDPYKTEAVKEFIRKIDKIAIQETYTLIGYGSLMKLSDAKKTLDVINFEYGYIRGYERIFNIGFDTAYLNVQRSEKTILNVALIEFPFYNLPNIIRRESLYEIETVQYDNRTALIAIASTPQTNDILEPQLNYLHLCLTGAKELGGLKAIDQFIDNTYCYSQFHNAQVTIREYLSKLNLINYIIRYDYSSR